MVEQQTTEEFVPQIIRPQFQGTLKDFIRWAQSCIFRATDLRWLEIERTTRDIDKLKS